MIIAKIIDKKNTKITQLKLGSIIGDGSLTPLLFKNIISPKSKLFLTLGNPVKIDHQKIICNKTGTFLVNST